MDSHFPNFILFVLDDFSWDFDQLAYDIPYQLVTFAVHADLAANSAAALLKPVPLPNACGLQSAKAGAEYRNASATKIDNFIGTSIVD